MLKSLAAVFMSVVISVASTLGLVSYHQRAANDFETLRAATHMLTLETIMIDFFTMEPVTGVCSGVAVAPDRILTAAHCWGEAVLNIKVEGKTATILKRDEAVDLMLLKVEGLDLKPIKVGRFPELDSKVVMVGFPFGVGEIITEGRYQGMFRLLAKAYPQIMNYIIVTAEAEGGNSGGGIYQFQDGEWKLIGITSRGSEHHTLAPNPDMIKDFLK